MMAPERIKMAHNGGLPTGNYPEADKVEYVRADIHAAALEKIERLEAALDRSKRLRDQYRAALDPERAHSKPARTTLGG